MKTLTETPQSLAADASTTRDRAVARALMLRLAIRSLRHQLLDEAEEPKSASTSVDAAISILASYDRELDRLCQIPGVLAAILAEMVIEETAP